MKKIITENSEDVSGRKEMTKEVVQFYSRLYASLTKKIHDENLNEIIDCNVPNLTYEEAERLKGGLTLEEATKVLKVMKNYKSPGSSGFAAEFFNILWKVWGVFLVRSLNYGFKTRTLAVTQREGVIICIPKPNKK